MAAQAISMAGVQMTGQFIPIGGRRIAAGIPEVFLGKEIDNSRLVKVTDRKRQREMWTLSVVLSLVGALMLLYAVQHFSSIQYGYGIEAQKADFERLIDQNRALRLEEASLRDPERIDQLARRMGLV